MSSLKIAQVTTTSTFLPEYYRSNEHLLCQGLAKRGHEVTLFTTDRPPKWQKLSERIIGRRNEECDGFTVQRLHGGPEIGVVPLTPSLFTTLLKMEFDVIHAHDYYAASSFYSALASRAKGVPLVLTQHNDTLPSPVLNAFLYKLDSYTLGRFTFFQAKKIIALTTTIKAHLIQMGSDEKKIEVIPNGVDVDVFSPKRRDLLEEQWEISRPVVLFTGRLVEEKEVKYLLQAFSEVSKEVSEAKLVIVGSGPEESRLRNLQKKLGLNNVFFLGTVKNELMPNVYVGCDVLVLPSTYEPFGNVVIEAMATAKPVIGSYVGGMKDTIVHGVTGYHVQPRSSQQISKYLTRLLKDESLKNRLGENARTRVLKHYDQELIIQKMERIYRLAIEWI